MLRSVRNGIMTGQSPSSYRKGQAHTKAGHGSDSAFSKAPEKFDSGGARPPNDSRTIPSTLLSSSNTTLI